MRRWRWALPLPPPRLPPPCTEQVRRQARALARCRWRRRTRLRSSAREALWGRHHRRAVLGVQHRSNTNTHREGELRLEPFHRPWQPLALALAMWYHVPKFQSSRVPCAVCSAGHFPCGPRVATGRCTYTPTGGGVGVARERELGGSCSATWLLALGSCLLLALNRGLGPGQLAATLPRRWLLLVRAWRFVAPPWGAPKQFAQVYSRRGALNSNSGAGVTTALCVSVCVYNAKGLRRVKLAQPFFCIFSPRFYFWLQM